MRGRPKLSALCPANRLVTERAPTEGPVLHPCAAVAVPSKIAGNLKEKLIPTLPPLVPWVRAALIALGTQISQPDVRRERLIDGSETVSAKRSEAKLSSLR